MARAMTREEWLSFISSEEVQESIYSEEQKCSLLTITAIEVYSLWKLQGDLAVISASEAKKAGMAGVRKELIEAVTKVTGEK